MPQINVTEMLQPIAQRCRQAPDEVLIQAFVDAAREFCSKTRWLATTIPGLCTVDVATYALGDGVYDEIIGINSMSVRDVGGNIPDRPNMTQKHSSRWDQTDAADQPRFWEYIPESQFGVHPTPNQAYPLIIGVVLQPKRGVVSLDTAMCRRWERTLRAGALEYMFNIADQPWSNPGQAANEGATFRDGINRAKSSVARGYNAGIYSTNANQARTSRPRSSVLAI